VFRHQRNVAAYGLVGDAKMGGQLFHGDIAFAMDDAQQFCWR
jgi:hypothetical protein